MPTYEYKCGACGSEFERFQSIKAAPVKVCPDCKKARVRRLISSGAGLIFKGSGFYITDYRSDGYKKAAQGDSSTGSAASSTASTGSGGSSAPAKSESKPESKPEKKSSSEAAGK
jgi:putative FmdB family regulatory protein